MTLRVTALGRSERLPGRAGARPGDLLVLTGSLGGAGAEFRCGRRARPPLRLGEGRRLARVAHAMLDISDGLAADSAHISYRSGVRCAIELERVPLADGAELAGWDQSPARADRHVAYLLAALVSWRLGLLRNRAAQVNQAAQTFS